MILLRFFKITSIRKPYIGSVLAIFLFVSRFLVPKRCVILLFNFQVKQLYRDQCLLAAYDQIEHCCQCIATNMPRIRSHRYVTCALFQYFWPCILSFHLQEC